MKVTLRQNGRASAAAAETNGTAGYFDCDDSRASATTSGQRMTTPSLAARVRYGRALRQTFKARAIRAGLKREKPGRPAWTDPESGIVWQQQGRGRNWKDGIPPWARGTEVKRTPMVREKPARRAWTDPETGITWQQQGVGRNWKNGVPPWARRTKVKRARAVRPAWTDPETGIVWPGRNQHWKEGMPLGAWRAKERRKKLANIEEELRELEAATGVKANVSGQLTLWDACRELTRMRDPRCHAAWKKWRGAAARFRGLGRHMQAEWDLRNIRLHPSGYQVVIRRTGAEFSRCFSGGYSEKVLERAKTFRDALLAEAPPRNTQPIPRQVLDELGLKEPVAGVSHCAQRFCFRTSRFGSASMRNFYYRRVSQADAYAAAIEAREEDLALRHEERLRVLR